MEPTVLESLDEGLFTITLNRPERRNALNLEITADLLKAAKHADENPAVRAVLLKGAGGTFCVGGDVKAMASREAVSVEDHAKQLRARMEATRVLHNLKKPTIAAIAGAAAGAGLSIALSCDLRIAGASAKITTAFAKVGLSGDFGGTYFLTKLIGSAKARELYLTSPLLTAEEAHQLGIVNRVVPDAKLEAAALAWGRMLASGPTLAYGYMKKNLNLAERGESLETVFEAEALGHGHLTHSADHKEAAKSFVEKRAPHFVGR
jgi:2-(1,2-epoxy-1,2-dihydrophenyl)acetyl-CoA isomerase